jgi:hypothetical protein
VNANENRSEVAMARGHYAHALVLAREHLAEFPGDELVCAALAEAAAPLERPTRTDDAAN